MCSCERAGWRSSILPYEHFSPVTGMKAGWILVVWMALSCIACYIFHIMSIPFNISDTALRVAKAMIGAEVSPCLFCFLNWAPELLISETGLKVLIWTQGEICPSNRAHVKRPWNYVKVTKFVGAVFLSYVPNLNGVSLVSPLVPLATYHMSVLHSLMWGRGETYNTVHRTSLTAK